MYLCVGGCCRLLRLVGGGNVVIMAGWFQVFVLLVQESGGSQLFKHVTSSSLLRVLLDIPYYLRASFTALFCATPLFLHSNNLFFMTPDF